MKMERFSVGESQPEMMGRPGVFGLWILGSMYSSGVRGGVLGNRKVCVVESMILSWWRWER